MDIHLFVTHQQHKKKQEHFSYLFEQLLNDKIMTQTITATLRDL